MKRIALALTFAALLIGALVIDFSPVSAIDVGILVGDETEVVALKNSVKTGYLSGYLANF